MAESVTIARPYAQAVYRLAKETGAQAVWLARLQRLSVITHDSEMSHVIGNPKFSATDVSKLLVSLTGEPENHELSSFIDLLAENERLDKPHESATARCFPAFHRVEGQRLDCYYGESRSQPDAESIEEHPADQAKQPGK